jgi:hypothetical protein
MSEVFAPGRIDRASSGAGSTEGQVAERKASSDWSPPTDHSPLTIHKLLWLGMISLGCHAGVAALSFRFVVGDVEGYTRRPILLVLGLLGAAFVCYLLAVWTVGRSGTRQSSGEWRGTALKTVLLLIFAATFRLVHLFGDPIQEIDIYRYLWDGQVSATAINPYRYSPNEAAVEMGYRVQPLPQPPLRVGEGAGGEVEDEWVWVGRIENPSYGDRLLNIVSHPAGFEIFWTVDHRAVRTIYPPLAQGVFGVAAMLTPADFSVRGHMLVMRVILLFFDLGVIGLLLLLLRECGKSPLWCLAYAWCPLVLKEVANSGHMDVIAVFFTVLTAYILVRAERRKIGGLEEWMGGRMALLAGTAYAAAILSKLYPLVLLPIIVRQCWQVGRGRAVLSFVLAALILVAGVYLAVWPHAEPVDGSGVTPFSGVKVFVAEWEMNDLIFHQLYRLVDRVLGAELQAKIEAAGGEYWPRRVATADPAKGVPVPPAYLLALLLSGLTLAAFTIWLDLRGKDERGRMKHENQVSSSFILHPSSFAPRSTVFLEGVFYSLAALFLLSPAANPWYFIWAVPFLPWARQFAWFVLSGLVLQYYLRFWFLYHYPDGGPPVPGTTMDGFDFFNEVWLWVEYVPFLALLLVELIRQRRQRRGGAEPSAG